MLRRKGGISRRKVARLRGGNKTDEADPYEVNAFVVVSSKQASPAEENGMQGVMNAATMGKLALEFAATKASLEWVLRGTDAHGRFFDFLAG